MKTTRKYFVTFGKDIKTLEKVYNTFVTAIHKGDVHEIDEDTYDALLKGYPVMGGVTLGHGVTNIRYEYNMGDIVKIVERKTTEDVVYKKVV